MSGQKKKAFHEAVAERLIEQLKAGTAPWQRPWEPGMGDMPMNPTTGKRYKGINAIYLMCQGRDDPRWMTYKQAAAAGAQVAKGEKGTPVQYWKFQEEKNKLNDQGRPVYDSLGKPVKETITLERPRVFFATVFNAEQIEGLPPIERKEHQWDACERAEKILKASGAEIHHSRQSRAYYRPSSDSIHLPDREQFPKADGYYATALHELGHWTGHQSRLNRDLIYPFGSEGYAKEELRAEIASMMLGNEIGIGHDPQQHAAYVASWIKALKDDPLEIFRASADAEKIHGYVLAFEQKQVQEQEQTKEQTQEALAVEDDFKYIVKGRIIEDDDLSYPIGILDEGIFELLEDRVGNRLDANVMKFQNLESALVALSGVVPAHDGMLADGDRVHLDIFRVDSKGNVSKLEGEEAAQLARVQEERVINDPHSADEDVLAAKTARKDAEAVALLSDADMKREISEQEEKLKAESQPREPVGDQKKEMIYIDVPFREKEEAKRLGARWDRQKQSWYVPPGVEISPFAKWTQVQEQRRAGQEQGTKQPDSRQYLAVPYGERGAAKAAGAQWDKAAKSWFVGPNADMERLMRWMPENVPSQQEPAMSPREEFSEALRSIGCVVGGEHPIMDGLRHRINVDGDKKGEQAGFYVGYLDGHPAGYMKNNRTGVEMRWKSKGYSLDPEEKAKLQAEAAIKLAERSAEQERLHESTAQRVSTQAASLVPVSQPTSYMRDKGISVHAGALTDTEGVKTYIPATDTAGKMWTMQYIQEDGTKRFAKDSRKEGCFHVVGGMDGLTKAPVVVISEGYATAATNAEVLGHSTVTAFDSGNLPVVAKAMRETFPDKPIVIAGDDDRHLELTQGVNPGRVKAIEAAKAVEGEVVFPIFAPGEAAYPTALEPITPQSFRNHLRASKVLENDMQLNDSQKVEAQRALLSSEQLAALDKIKRHSDFNDLATKSELGIAGVKRQVETAVDKAVLSRGQKQEEKKINQHKQERRAARIR